MFRFSATILLLMLAWTASAEERDRSVSVNGAVRHFTQFTPARVAEPLPLLIVFHGGGQDKARARKYTGFDKLTEREKLVVVYPQGLANNWNDGRRTADLVERASAQANDVEFTSLLIDLLAADGLINRTRVYLTGASNGGMMSMYAACELGSKIRAIAPVVANQPADWTCKRTSVPALFIHGTEDAFMPYKGGKIAEKQQRRDLGTVLSVEATIGLFRKMNGCTGVKDTKRIDAISYDKTVAVLTAYDCATAPLTHYVIEGGGHTWPGARSGIFADWILGTTSREIDATEVILEFFKSMR